MNTDSWMPIWIGDYLADTMHLNMGQHGCFFLLLCAYWKNKGPIPNDTEYLRNVARCDPQDWARTWGIVSKFFVVEGAFIRNRRADEELKKAMENLEKRQNQTKAATEARLNALTTNVTSDVTTNVTSDDTSDVTKDEKKNVTSVPSPSPSPSTPIPPKPSFPSKRKSSLPKEAIFWNENCASLPKIQSMSCSRTRHLEARRRDPFWAEHFEEAVGKISQSDFCLGKGPRGWLATFDWVLRPDTVAKVMEGIYEARQRNNPKSDNRNVSTLNQGRASQYRGVGKISKV